MTLTRLALQSLWRFRRTNLGVMLGVAVTAAVICGALIVGDSMRYTLQQTAFQRLGAINYAMMTGDRFVTSELLASSDPAVSHAILLQGVVSTPDGLSRANQVQVCGVDDQFAQLTGLKALPHANEVVINQPLAHRLGAKAGDTLILRVPEPSALPIDAALANASRPSRAIQVGVAEVAQLDQGGRFSLRAEQRVPESIFIDRSWLAEKLGVPGGANTLLSKGDPGPVSPALADLELSYKPAPDGHAELTTKRVFIDKSIEQDLADIPGQRILTYLVNSVELNNRQSPYAMVCAVDRLGTLELKENEIALNQWLAEDLEAKVGDTVLLTYYLPAEGDKLVEDRASFVVSSIVPIEAEYADRTLTPGFPGLAEADNLRKWDAGPAIDRSRIRDKDEAYWEQYRATPKAFIGLSAGQRLWSNRFGSLTAIRFDPQITDAMILDRIDPSDIGLSFRDVAGQARVAAKGTIDFSQLFLSLSAFIIISAIILTATLFAMSVEQRARQLGTLRAVGLTKMQLLVLLMIESGAIASVGVLLGLVGGVAYALAVIDALGGLWSSAVAQSAILRHISARSLCVGSAITLLIVLVSIPLALSGLLKKPVRSLLSGAVGRVSGESSIPEGFCVVCGIVFVVIGTILAYVAAHRSGMQGGLWGFAAGSTIMFAMLLGLISQMIRRSVLSRSSRHPAAKSIAPITLWTLAFLGFNRRRGRSIASVVMLGCGLFLVLAVSGFQLGTGDDTDQRVAGTGGFALIVESTKPIHYDLNTALGRDHYAITEKELPPGSIVPIRVSPGDDTSCLNLNQTPTPRILGVDPALLQNRQAFRFQSLAFKASGWGVLSSKSPINRDTIPAVADANTAQWALKLGLGNTLTLTDQHGKPFTIELVGTIDNSILQGSLIISEERFESLFPDTSGYRMLLVDAAQQSAPSATASLLAQVMVDDGVQITETRDRLSQFNSVQNTYLMIFQALGGLGVVLGSLGMGVITARNLLERKAEIALLSAIGFSRSRLFVLMMLEHGLILGAGVTLGLVGAWIGTLHTRKGLSDDPSTWLLIGTTVLIAGLAAIVLGLRSATSGQLTQAIRND